MIFNPEKHFLGKLCKNGHEYLDTCMSMRYLGENRCVICKRETEMRYVKNNIEKRNSTLKRFYAKNPTYALLRAKDWNSKNPIARKRISNAYSKKASAGLFDCYLKAVITRHTDLDVQDVTQEMLDLKRAQMTMKRLINNLKGELKHDKL